MQVVFPTIRDTTCTTLHGPKQIEDVRKEKQYLEKVLAQVT